MIETLMGISTYEILRGSADSVSVIDVVKTQKVLQPSWNIIKLTLA